MALQNENLRLAANNSAWMDIKSFENWIETIWAPYSKKFLRTVIIMDHFRVHTNPQILQKLSDLNTDVLLVPPGLTFYVQPLDVYVNGPVKRKLRESWEEYMVNTQPNETTGNLILTNLILIGKAPKLTRRDEL